MPPYPQENEFRSIRVDALPPMSDAIYLFSCFHDNAKVLAATVLRNWRTGLPLGYGFVEFASHSDAEFVLESYNGERMPNFNHERFCLSWDTDGSGARWRWDYTYERCSFFGYNKIGNEMDAKTMIENYMDSVPSVVTTKRAYPQSAYPNSPAAYMETDGDKRLKLVDMPLTHPNMYQQGYAGPSLTIQQNQPDPMQRNGGCGAGYVNDQVPKRALEMVSSMKEEKELYLGFEEVNYRRSCYVFRTIKLSELLVCSCKFNREAREITRCVNCASKTKKGSQLLQRAWLFTGEKVPESCGGKDVKIPTRMGSCAYGSRIIFAGGLVPRPDEETTMTAAHVPCGDVYSFEPESCVWKRLDWSIPKAKPEPLLFEVNGNLYCLAGAPPEHPSFEVYDSSSRECLFLPHPPDSIPELDNWRGYVHYRSFNRLACAVVGSKILISSMGNVPAYYIPIICFDVNDKKQKWRMITSLFDGKPFPFDGRALVLDLDDGTHDKVMFSFRNEGEISVSRLVVDDDGDISISYEKWLGIFRLLCTFVCKHSPSSYTFVDLGDKTVAFVVCANMFSGIKALGKVRVVVVVICYDVLGSKKITSEILATRTFEYNCHSSGVMYTKFTSGFVL
uniref:uncharacterized protein LOC105353323 n=1 Tax=Fragaria vesca subsp. vesca TaxID=101020 RepID=UPI0005C85FBC|nr:PREDICTED: uncharacterized protein LOC105353323 [Fragaria vesca subsp. vesca]